MHKGFTLAEVLVILLIIGIIASETLPSLIKKHQINELRAGLKAGYAILSQGVNQMKADEESGIRSRYLGDDYSFKPVFIKYFKVAKDCRWQSCVASIENNSPIYKKYSKQSGASTYLFDEGQFILTNGMTVFIQNHIFKNTGLLVSIDVNGYKKAPNAWGHDLFTFEIMGNDVLLPAGAAGTGTNGLFGSGFANEQATYCDSLSTDVYNGVGCTARALTDDSYWDNLP